MGTSYCEIHDIMIAEGYNCPECYREELVLWLDVITEKAKVYWLSRHDLSPAQLRAIHDLHGDDVEIIKESVVFSDTNGLAEYIRERGDGFVYAVAGAAHYLRAAERGMVFGIFQNHPAKRQDGTFGLAAVYHVQPYCTADEPIGRCGGHEHGIVLKEVWINPDPESDKGEALVPVLQR